MLRAHQVHQENRKRTTVPPSPKVYAILCHHSFVGAVSCVFLNVFTSLVFKTVLLLNRTYTQIIILAKPNMAWDFSLTAKLEKVEKYSMIRSNMNLQM